MVLYIVYKKKNHPKTNENPTKDSGPVLKISYFHCARLVWVIHYYNPFDHTIDFLLHTYSL